MLALTLVWTWASVVDSLVVTMAKFRETCVMDKSADASVTDLSISAVSLAGQLDRFVHLEHLVVHGNNLTIEGSVFDKLVNLKTLYLNATGLKFLPEGVFGRLTRLEKLYLNDNSLEELPLGIFNNLTNLKELHLAKNHLTELDPGAFAQLTELKRLLLNDNNLRGLPEISTANAALQQLCLGSVVPESLADVCRKMRDRGVFDKMKHLEELDLQNNQIETLPGKVFDQLTNLAHLFLNGNSLRDLPEGVFDMLTSLEQLHIFGNDLGDLQKEDFDTLANLEQLNFRGV